MFREVRRSSSGAPTVFAASGLHTYVVTGRSQVDYGRSPHAYVNQRLQIQLELLMMSGVPLETCWAFNERWNNKFCYKITSCWLFLLNSYRVAHAFKFQLKHKNVHIANDKVLILHTYTLTPCSRDLLEKLTGFQLVKKFLTSCGIRLFITAFTNARHLPLSRASWIQSIPPHPLPEDPF